MNDLTLNVVAFDLDGTLLDTASDLAAALNHVLRSLGRQPLPDEQVRVLVGHGARALIRRGLEASGESTPELVEAMLPVFLDYYSDNICTDTHPFDGVETALDALLGKGVALAICTNKPEPLTLQLIDHIGWTDRFASIVGAGTLPVRKPDAAPLLEAIRRAGGNRALLDADHSFPFGTAPTCP